MGESSAEDALLRLVQEHAAELLRFARRFSWCADDAHDAYQRSLEILVGRMRSEPPTSPLSWLRTVLRHEALAIRAQRSASVSRADVDFDDHEDRHVEDPAERVAGRERLRHTAEALQRLKPQEVTALVLRAEGLSYKEICTRTGWTYTRCNRAVTEGRRALVDRLGAIESGAECERWLPLLSALADGEAGSAELAELRPHLRSCSACRATLRDFHAAPAHLAALVPVAVLPVAADSGGTLLHHLGVVLHGIAERASLAAMRVQGAFEGVSGMKVAAVAASTAALAGGGAAIEQATRADDMRSRGAADTAVVAAPAVGRAATSLLTIAVPLPARPRHEPRARRLERRGEFAPSSAGAAEFAPRTTAPAEFASAAAAGAAAQPPASSPPSPPPPPPPSASPAFAKPAPVESAPEFAAP